MPMKLQKIFLLLQQRLKRLHELLLLVADDGVQRLPELREHAIDQEDSLAYLISYKEIEFMELICIKLNKSKFK